MLKEGVALISTMAMIKSIRNRVVKVVMIDFFEQFAVVVTVVQAVCVVLALRPTAMWEALVCRHTELD